MHRHCWSGGGLPGKLETTDICKQQKESLCPYPSAQIRHERYSKTQPCPLLSVSRGGSFFALIGNFSYHTVKYFWGIFYRAAFGCILFQDIFSFYVLVYFDSIRFYRGSPSEDDGVEYGINVSFIGIRGVLKPFVYHMWKVVDRSIDCGRQRL